MVIKQLGIIRQPTVLNLLLWIPCFRESQCDIPRINFPPALCSHLPIKMNGCWTRSSFTLHSQWFKSLIKISIKRGCWHTFVYYRSLSMFTKFDLMVTMKTTWRARGPFVYTGFYISGRKIHCSITFCILLNTNRLKTKSKSYNHAPEICILTVFITVDRRPTDMYR